MKHLTVFLSVSVLVAAWIGCGGSSPTRPDLLTARQLPDSLRSEASGVVQENNAFAVSLYQELIKEKDGNLFLSPFSISTAFAMTYAGARGETESQMAQVFGFPMPQDRLHAVFGALLRSLDTGTSYDGYRLNLANRLFGQKGFGFTDSYLAVTRDDYDAELETMNFESDPDGSRRHINTWVEDKTEQCIKDLLPTGSVTSDTRLVLVNAIYFKGDWADQFDPALTRDGAFHVAPGNDVTVPFMHRTGDYTIGYGEGVQLLELPYKGKDLSMIVLLPAAGEGSLEALEARLTAQDLESWLGAGHETEVNVTFPKFTMTSEFTLKSTLSAMGMPVAFTDRADLSGMNGSGGLFIQDAYHKAFVKVDEEGTEAAAATGTTVGLTSLPPEFRADHPFLFLIRDNVTGSILFLGRVMDPSAGE
jgi:serpin B